MISDDKKRLEHEKIVQEQITALLEDRQCDIIVEATNTTMPATAGESNRIEDQLQELYKQLATLSKV